MVVEQEPVKPGDAGIEKFKSITAGLFESDYHSLQNLAAEMSLSRSQVVRMAVQNFLQRHQAGEITLTAEEGILLVQPAAQAAAAEPAPKTTQKKKQKSSKKGKKKKKDTKPSRKKK